MKGKVKWFNEKKGYGFITGEDGKDYFVHFSAIKAEGYKKLRDEQRVEFTPAQGERGPQATEVTVVMKEPASDAKKRDRSGIPSAKDAESTDAAGSEGTKSVEGDEEL